MMSDTTTTLAVTTLAGDAAGEIALPSDVFDLDPRADLLHRMVRYQLAKRQAGTHKTKARSEITGSRRKIVRQKGSGGARHGDKKVAQFRGGTKAFGPVPRSHAIDLPKKVRALALRHALSAKKRAGELVVIDDAAPASAKTKDLKLHVAKHGWRSALIVGGQDVPEALQLSARNLPEIDVLPVQGINVYDILRRDQLVLTRAAVDALVARFEGQTATKAEGVDA